MYNYKCNNISRSISVVFIYQLDPFLEKCAIWAMVVKGIL